MTVVVSEPSRMVGAPDAAVRVRSDVDRWLAPENWTIPKWYGYPPDRTPSFETFFTKQLRARYLELEGDFRSVVGNFPPEDASTAQTIFEYLQVVRPALEAKTIDLLTVSSTLDLIERYMVWVYPAHIVQTRIASVRLRLETLKPYGWEEYARKLDAPVQHVGHKRAPLDEAIAACNRIVMSRQIGSGLQIKRLRGFGWWGMAMLMVFFAATPLLVAPTTFDGWPVERLLGEGARLTPWLNAASVLIVGMLGGFLSGLLQSRSSQVTLSDYQETMVKLMLRPIVGGMIALILSVLLSWKLVPSIDVQNAGTFFLAAFLSGFSERYFLRLLDLDKDQAADQPGAATAAKPSASSEPTPASNELAGPLMR